MNRMMGRTIANSVAFTVVGTVVAGLLGQAAVWIVALWVGTAWGLANTWCLNRLLTIVLSGAPRGRLGVLLTVKLVGLFGGLVWLLAGLRLPALAFLSGFTLVLVGLGVSAAPLLHDLSTPPKTSSG